MITPLDLILHWSIPPTAKKELSDADVILTHEFGDQKTPSKTTRQIVELGVELSTRLSKPLICQYPGDQAARELDVEPFAIIREHLLKPGEYLDTEEVNRQAAQICKKNGWNKVILCAHPHHIWRASKNMQHHRITVLYPDTSSIEYDPDCSREELSSAWRFMRREIWARYVYKKRGWL